MIYQLSESSIYCEVKDCKSNTSYKRLKNLECSVCGLKPTYLTSIDVCKQHYPFFKSYIYICENSTCVNIFKSIPNNNNSVVYIEVH